MAQVVQEPKISQQDDTQKAIKPANKTKPSYKHIPHSQKPPHLVAKRNARERRRVQAVNQAFYRLRRSVPIENRNKRVSKVKTLQRAIDYIRKLERILAEDEQADEATSSGGRIGPADEATQRINLMNLSSASSAATTTSTSDSSSSLTPTKRRTCDPNQVPGAKPRRGRRPAVATAATTASAATTTTNNINNQMVHSNPPSYQPVDAYAPTSTYPVQLVEQQVAYQSNYAYHQNYSSYAEPTLAYSYTQQVAASANQSLYPGSQTSLVVNHSSGRPNSIGITGANNPTQLQVADSSSGVYHSHQTSGVQFTNLTGHFSADKKHLIECSSGRRRDASLNPPEGQSSNSCGPPRAAPSTGGQLNSNVMAADSSTPNTSLLGALSCSPSSTSSSSSSSSAKSTASSSSSSPPPPTVCRRPTNVDKDNQLAPNSYLTCYGPLTTSSYLTQIGQQQQQQQQPGGRMKSMVAANNHSSGQHGEANNFAADQHYPHGNSNNNHFNQLQPQQQQHYHQQSFLGNHQQHLHQHLALNQNHDQNHNQNHQHHHHHHVQPLADLNSQHANANTASQLTIIQTSLQGIGDDHYDNATSHAIRD